MMGEGVSSDGSDDGMRMRGQAVSLLLLTRRSSLFLDGVFASSLSAISAVLPSHHTVREDSNIM